LLSVNEGKLPLGNTQNTYIPFDVRKNFGLNTFLENDSIYAYHFYRLIQNSENVHLLYNALSSGVNTGEKAVYHPIGNGKSAPYRTYHYRKFLGTNCSGADENREE
jgi:hypothetical protein